MSERFPIGAQVQVKNDGHGSQYRSESERVGEFAGTVVAVNGPKYTGIPEVCVESVTGERRVILVGDLEEGVAATETPTEVTEYSVKIWYRSGAYEGAPHCLEDLARKIYADAVKSDGVEFAELHGPSGKLVESKTPNEESTVTTEQPTENLFLAGLPLLHPEPLPPAPLNVSQHGEDLTAAYSAQDPAPEVDDRDAACVAGDEEDVESLTPGS